MYSCIINKLLNSVISNQELIPKQPKRKSQEIQVIH